MAMQTAHHRGREAGLCWSTGAGHAPARSAAETQPALGKRHSRSPAKFNKSMAVVYVYVGHRLHMYIYSTPQVYIYNTQKLTSDNPAQDLDTTYTDQSKATS